MPKHRKAINFDLDTKILESIFKNTRKPYSDIKKALIGLGFEHRQYSGYTSIEKLSETAINTVVRALLAKLPWLSTPGLVQKIDVTDIGKQYDLSSLLQQPTEIDKSKIQPTPPKKSTLSINDLIQATEDTKEGELSAPGRDTPDVDERD